ncbi:MAG: MBL fold metallo-hydrolase [Anaerolineae bacterium]|nr:MBL fold metallo-hydrolase [Anaerolineae bacterium]
MPDIALRIGTVRAWLLDCGVFRYDGGLIFGAVPRATWERYYPPDADHLVPVGLRPLLIESGEGYVLVNTGLPPGDPGLPFDPPGYRPLEAALRELGVRGEEIVAVVLTHLHPDHTGGSLTSTDGALAPAFPAARYFVQREEAAAAAFPNERTRADYDPRQLQVLDESGALEVVAGTYRVNQHVWLVPAPGHTAGQQLVRIVSEGKSALYLSDLAIVPIQAERLAWISALDIAPMQSLESKRELLGRAVEEETLLLFEHEPDTSRSVGYLRPDGKRWRFEPSPGDLTRSLPRR